MKTISWYDYIQSYLSSILLHLVTSLNSNLDFIANGFSLYATVKIYKRLSNVTGWAIYTLIHTLIIISVMVRQHAHVLRVWTFFWL